MIHYSCDCCRRTLDPAEDLRYVVKMEILAVLDTVDEEELEGDRDHLLEIHEILERSECADSENVGEDVYQRVRYDLCAECRKRFVRDPFGHESAVQLNFSQN